MKSKFMKDQEKILCSAIYYKGNIIGGLRHCNCIGVIASLVKNIDQKEIHDNQGFLTSYGRFLGREESRILAHRIGQIRGNTHQIGYLFSEDLF